MNEFDRLGTRAGFNNAVRHLQTTIAMDENVGAGKNIADVLHKIIAEGEIVPEQGIPIVNALLVTKHSYRYKSFNMEESIEDFGALVEEVAKWNALDLVVTYRHPNLGYSVINPKRIEHWQRVQDIMKDELVVVYGKYIGNEKDEGKAEKTIEKALTGLYTLLHGGKITTSKDFVDDSLPQTQPSGDKAPAQQQAQAQAPQEQSSNFAISPKYSVQVSNELFHNGNVEAWKNVIEAYEDQNPGLKVSVFHDGELIQDLNTLFKWGKVKHGGLIFFQVSGENLRNVAKLKRYLYEGASERFESFMKKDMSRPLPLFK